MTTYHTTRCPHCNGALEEWTNSGALAERMRLRAENEQLKGELSQSEALYKMAHAHRSDLHDEVERQAEAMREACRQLQHGLDGNWITEQNAIKGALDVLSKALEG